ncbi:lipopolysaccharide biosynthesis protein [Pseudomonas sp. NPDC086251]|uniref:lipopolysaccharide biosynthesis protein n=1 Tax=Pseudomonas sp. NPDC086251 TaxID=3364431 RepID=UPI0038334D82
MFLVDSGDAIGEEQCLGERIAARHLDRLNVHNFDDCRNIGSGPIFIIASGPSAKNFPVDHFSHIPMITMNGAISAFTSTAVRPYFYVCSDKNFSTQQPALFNMAMRLSQRAALWQEHVELEKLQTRGELYFLSKPGKSSLRNYVFRDKDLVRYHSLLSARKNSLGFSKNLHAGFFDARTVAYVALQLCYHLGFNEVYLVGVDLDQQSGRFYEDSNSLISPCDIQRHLHSRILPSLRFMAKKIVGKDFKVYNLSKSSRIPNDIIPYKDIATI